MAKRTAFLCTFLAWSCCAAAAAEQPPIPAGATPQNHGQVEAREGPAWHPKGGLYFTGRDRILRRDSQGTVNVFRNPAGGANGLLFDPQGRLITCESSARRVTRAEPDGAITVLTDNFEGRKYNSPNDLAMDSRGRIYFTDPRYGDRSSMEMRDAGGSPERNAPGGRLVEGVYRIDAAGKVTRIIGHEVDRPNGILVSPDDRFLYVADNNNNTVGGARKLWRFRLRPDGSVAPASRRQIFDWKDGRGPDGIKMDARGRLYVAGGLNRPNPPFESADRFKGGVYVLSPKGKLLAFVAVPVDEVTNCAFGEADGKTLFITAGGTLWSVPVNAAGVTFARRRR